MDLTWEEAEELANDKAEWHRRVAQCSHLDAGWIKVECKEQTLTIIVSLSSVHIFLVLCYHNFVPHDAYACADYDQINEEWRLLRLWFALATRHYINMIWLKLVKKSFMLDVSEREFKTLNNSWKIVTVRNIWWLVYKGLKRRYDAWIHLCRKNRITTSNISLFATWAAQNSKRL